MEAIRIEVLYHDGSKDVFDAEGQDPRKWFWTEEVPKGTAHSELAVKRYEVARGSIFEALAEAFLRTVQGQIRR